MSLFLAFPTNFALVDRLLTASGEFEPHTGLGLTGVGCSEDLVTACIMSSLTWLIATHTDIRPPVGEARLAVVFVAPPGARRVVAVCVTSTVVYLGK